MTCTGMASFFPPNFMLQASHEDDGHLQPPNSLNHLHPSCTSSQDFHGVGSFLGKRSSMSPYSGFHEQELGNNNNGGGDDEFSDEDEGSQVGDLKKRRLNMEQVKTLERSFELGNKLEPERKMQLAKALGLQPRQIAIWFQNRRARWKTKQLEKDYNVLKRQFDSLKSENDSLQALNKKLHAEILGLKNREPTDSINLNIKETEGSSSNRSDNSSDNIKVDIISTAVDSPHHHNIPTSINLFPSPNPNIISRSSSTPHQLFHNSSSRPELQLQFSQHPKIDNQTTTTIVKEESFSNMFCGIEDQNGFWPWLEQHQFN